MAASRADWMILLSEIVESQKEIFSLIVPLKINTSWSITAKDSVMMWRGISLLSLPSNKTSPFQGEYNPEATLATVDLPLPDPPTKATLLPGFNFKLKFSIKAGIVVL